MTFNGRLRPAEGGDVLLNVKSIIGASLAADLPRRRPVLQIDYTAYTAPSSFGLRHLIRTESSALGYLNIHRHLYAWSNTVEMVEPARLGETVHEHRHTFEELP